jgi:hypothetical protein
MDTMRISQRNVLIGVVALSMGWMVRGIAFDADASPRPQSSAPVAIASSVEAESLPRLSVDHPAYASSQTRSTRNLFGYVERAVPVPAPVVRPLPAPMVVAPPAALAAPAVEQPRLRFAYRFIGRFGPNDRPVAAFSRDGEVVTARIGDRVGEHFVLRSIGIESVEVEAVVGGEVQKERVPLNSSAV